MNWLKSLWHEFAVVKAILQSDNERLQETNIALEIEVAELRRDNRALVNAQLKQAGIVSLPDLEPKPAAIPRMRRLTLHQRQKEHAFMTDPRRKAEEANGEIKS